MEYDMLDVEAGMQFEEYRRQRVAHIEAALKGEICSRCEATLETFVDRCKASLSDPCPGFEAIDKASQEFFQKWKETGKAGA